MAEAAEGAIDETLVEMTYGWSDVEHHVQRDDRNPLRGALVRAFRVEAREDHNDFGDRFTIFDLLFDGEDPDARAAARVVRENGERLGKIVNQVVEMYDRRYTHHVRVVGKGTASRGLVCTRLTPPSTEIYLDASDVPVRKPTGDAPFTQKDGHYLTPIEVPFYDALIHTDAIFSVQPWVQVGARRFRPDFIVYYAGGAIVVELDGHDFHKTREQRTKDASRQRWFEARGIKVLRWTGSEVHANAEKCVQELLAIVRLEKATY